jgi:hypothetical protein
MKILGFLCFILLSQGIGGLANEFTGGRFHLWALTHKIGFLDGYQIYADIALIVLGLALAAAAGSPKGRTDSS